MSRINIICDKGRVYQKLLWINNISKILKDRNIEIMNSACEELMKNKIVIEYIQRYIAEILKNTKVLEENYM